MTSNRILKKASDEIRPYNLYDAYMGLFENSKLLAAKRISTKINILVENNMRMVDILASRVPADKIPLLAAQTKNEVASVEALKKLAALASSKTNKPKPATNG